MTAPAAAVAAIVPAHNAAATLDATLRSALAQSLAPSEIIVVDDGSTDGTAEIAERFTGGAVPVTIVRQARQGPSAARNAAIEATTADYIAPLDADDLWHRDYLHRCVSALQARPAAGFAYAWHHLIDSSGTILRGPMPFTVEGEALDCLLLGNFVGCGSAAVFRRAAMLEAGLYQAPLSDWPGAEDYLLQMRIAGRWQVACVQQDLVAYRKSPRSLSTNAEAARRARMAAVRIAAAEFGPVHPSVLGWAEGDADRVLMIDRLRRGRIGGAVLLALRALAVDPSGTCADIGKRLGNLAGRITRRGAQDRTLDPLLGSRMRILAGR